MLTILSTPRLALSAWKHRPRRDELVSMYNRMSARSQYIALAIVLANGALGSAFVSLGLRACVVPPDLTTYRFLLFCAFIGASEVETIIFGLLVRELRRLHREEDASHRE